MVIKNQSGVVEAVKKVDYNQNKDYYNMDFLFIYTLNLRKVSP